MDWKTKDGRTISIEEMENSHLLNTINFLRRKANPVLKIIALKMAFSAFHYAQTAPDGAAMAAEEEANRLLHGEGLDYIHAEESPVFCALMTEASKRGLII